MRSSKSRSRSKSNRQRSLGNIINRVFDSSGPEGKVRGTPQQIIDKYLALARDAQLSNDRVLEQAFLQHAEHYTRMLGEAQREMAREQESRQQQGQPGGNGNGQGYRDDRGDRGDRGEGRGEGRQGDGRDRDQRPARADDQDQPDFAPLGGVMDDPRDEGPGLVETPEMYHETRPREPEAPAPREADQAQGGERRAPKGDRSPRGPRGPRKPRGERPARGEGGEAGQGPAAPAPESSDAD